MKYGSFGHIWLPWLLEPGCSCLYWDNCTVAQVPAPAAVTRLGRAVSNHCLVCRSWTMVWLLLRLGLQCIPRSSFTAAPALALALPQGWSCGAAAPRGCLAKRPHWGSAPIWLQHPIPGPNPGTGPTVQPMYGH